MKVPFARIEKPAAMENKLSEVLSHPGPVQVGAVAGQSKPGRPPAAAPDMARDLVGASAAVALAVALTVAGFVLSPCPSGFLFGAGAPWFDFYNVGYNSWAVAASQSQALDRMKSPPVRVERRDTANHSAWTGVCG